MALTGAGLWAARKAAMDAVTPVQGTAAQAQAYRDALGLADSTAIVTYFVTNTVVTTTYGAPDGEHTGGIA